MVFIFIGLILLSYLVGSIPTSFIVGKVMKGMDLREHGSGNLGATNAFRVLGWKGGIFVLVCDILKGALPVLILPRLAARGGLGFLEPHNLALVIGLAAILGHIFTLFMKFKGGKGVATSMGVFLALAPKAFAITLPVCILLIVLTRYVSVGSLTGALLLPILVYVFYPGQLPLILFTILIGLVILIRHRTNIRRLIQGRENKIFP